MQPAAACKIGPDERAVLAHRQHANGVQVLRSTAHQNGSELEKRMKNVAGFAAVEIDQITTGFEDDTSDPVDAVDRA